MDFKSGHTPFLQITYELNIFDSLHFTGMCALYMSTAVHIFVTPVLLFQSQDFFQKMLPRYRAPQGHINMENRLLYISKSRTLISIVPVLTMPPLSSSPSGTRKEGGGEKWKRRERRGTVRTLIIKPTLVMESLGMATVLTYKR